MDEASIFVEALQRTTPGDRAAYLDQACAGDEALRHNLEMLLKAHEKAGDYLNQPAAAVAVTTDESALTDGPGTVIGPYKLLEPIGEGGFGVVYLAEQTAPVRRKVALKILKAGMDTRQVVARFEAERQALAIMDHPNIARVFDGGTTTFGRPFFVMELVKGVPITDYCDQHHLAPRQRLELFTSVCSAVQHAHQKGIIHRDLKPSNVLVTRHDSTPVVKVIDFGVAKALGQQLTDRTLFTGLAQMIGTPLYMSPEQAGMSDLDVDTRSDVYSLGVLLYELLTGTTPFTKERFRRAAYDEIRRIIREEEPPRPSTRLSESTDSLPSVAAQRQTEPSKLTKLVRGELDWIVMKALEKDRDRRYETANGFAMDVQRYLAGEPVLAVPASQWYRFQKFLRRNRGQVLAGAALAVTLMAGVGAVLAVEARAVRDRAAVAADLAAREAGTTASVVEAVREARARAAEAWDLHDHPEHMRAATEAAQAAIRRADGFIGAGSSTDAASAEVSAGRREVDELARHTDMITDCVANQRKFIDDLNSDVAYAARLRLCRRHREALQKFGLNVVGDDPEGVARAVAASRLRDAVLGTLQEWHFHESYCCRMQGEVEESIKKRENERTPQSGGARRHSLPAPDPVARDRVDRVLRVARKLCGGAYARWQDLLDRNDATGLAAFAASPEALQFRSNLVNALARDLDTAGQNAACLAFRRAAVDRYPHDVWLQRDLYMNCTLAPSMNWAEALRHASAASVQWPSSASFLNKVGLCYVNLGAFDNAADVFRKAITLEDRPGYAYLQLGSALRQKKDYDGAAAALREALRFSPDSTEARSLLDQVHREKKDWDGELDDPRANLKRLQGTWQWTAVPDGKPMSAGERVLKEVRGDKETVTWYGPNDEVRRSHRVTIFLGMTGQVRTLSYSEMEILHGPNKGQKINASGTYVYVQGKDAFYEVLNVRVGEGPSAPTIRIWKRIPEK